MSTFQRRALIAAFLTLALGFWIRFTPAAPEWLRDSAGGAAYVMLWALLAAAARPKGGAAVPAAGAFLLTCAIEALQAWHPLWLDAIRRTTAGRLVLGTTFAWHDFPPYAAGGIASYVLLRLLSSRGGGRAVARGGASAR